MDVRQTQTFYSGNCKPCTKPCRKLLKSPEIVKNPHKPHEQANVFQLMSLKLILYFLDETHFSYVLNTSNDVFYAGFFAALANKMLKF